VAALFFLLGIWEHANGNIYSDIVAVYRDRFCSATTCVIGGLPYINNFVEYPPLTGFFMYAMGMLGHLLPYPGRDFIVSYYFYSTLFLLIPTFLLISNLLKITGLIGIGGKYRRYLIYLVATPSFIFMLLLNWYVIGIFFAVWGLRKFLEGNDSNGTRNRISSGALLGLSAASNLITAVPALGMLIFGTVSWKERASFVFGIVVALLVIYVPLIVLNSFPHSYVNAQHVVVQFDFQFPNLNVISDFLQYQQNWYVEGSWMLVFFSSTNPIRNYIFAGLFIGLSVAIVLKGLKLRKNQVLIQPDRANLVVMTSSLFTFAFLFSSYVCTPQMNLILLPFFVLIPLMTRNYPEFLAFEIVNSLVIVWGFSAPLAFLGINIPTPNQFGSVWTSPIQFLAVLRSFWIGKFLIYDGLFKWKSIRGESI